VWLVEGARGGGVWFCGIIGKISCLASYYWHTVAVVFLLSTFQVKL
jgi:hypothetical protein